MKKFVALIMLLVLSFTVFALTACGKKEEEPSVTPPVITSRPGKDSKVNSGTQTTPSTDNKSEQPNSDNGGNSSVIETPNSSVQEPNSSTQEPTSSNEPTSSQEPTSSVVTPDPGPTPTPSGEILSTTETSVKNSLYISSLRVGSAGLYYLGSNSGSNYIFKVEVTQGSTTYVLNASDMTAFAKEPGKANGERIPCGTNNYFTLLCAATKTAIDASEKTFTDSFSGTQRINFGGKTQAVSGVMTNAIEFTTTDAADVKVWWVSGGDGRQVDIIKGESSPVTPEPTVPAEVTALISQIDLIGEITEGNYVAKETEVAAAESAYTALGADNQALVTNYAKLTSARAAINEFKAAAEAEAAAQEKVTAFKTAVGAIGEVSFTPDCKALLDAADAAYALVPTTHQSQVATEKAELEAKKQAYLDAELATLPQEVQDVMTSINAIGEITVDNYLAKETEISGIESAYTALTPDNQALVSNYATLTSAKAKVEEFKAAEAAAQEKITEFKNLVTAIGTVEYTQTCKDAIDAADAAYNAIPSTHVSQVATEKATLDSAKAEYENLAALSYVEAFKDAVNAIGTVEATQTCKDAIDAAYEAYNDIPSTHTANAAEAKATLDNAKAQYEEAVAISYVTAFESAVSAIATPITVDSKAAIDAAYTAYNAIPATHTANAAEAKTTLDGYKAQYDAAVQLAADQQVVNTFMTSYNAVASLTMNSTNYTQFQTVIDAFDKLTASQLALLDASVATNVATWKANIGNFKPKVVYTYDFSKFSGSVPNSNGVTYFSATGLSNSGTNKVTKNSGSYTLTSNYGVTFAGESTVNKGLAVSSTNLSKFEISLEIANPSKVTIYFSRASGGNASNMTSVGSGFAYTAGGVATSGTARVATQTEVSSGYEKVAVIEQDVQAGTATFNLASSSRACVYKIIVEEK